MKKVIHWLSNFASIWFGWENFSFCSSASETLEKNSISFLLNGNPPLEFQWEQLLKKKCQKMGRWSTVKLFLDLGQMLKESLQFGIAEKQLMARLGDFVFYYLTMMFG